MFPDSTNNPQCAPSALSRAPVLCSLSRGQPHTSSTRLTLSFTGIVECLLSKCNSEDNNGEDSVPLLKDLRTQELGPTFWARYPWSHPS